MRGRARDATPQWDQRRALQGAHYPPRLGNQQLPKAAAPRPEGPRCCPSEARARHEFCMPRLQARSRHTAGAAEGGDLSEGRRPERALLPRAASSDAPSERSSRNRPKSAGFGPKSPPPNGGQFLTGPKIRRVLGTSKTVRQTGMAKIRRILAFNPCPTQGLMSKSEGFWPKPPSGQISRSRRRRRPKRGPKGRADSAGRQPRYARLAELGRRPEPRVRAQARARERAIARGRSRRAPFRARTRPRVRVCR